MLIPVCAVAIVALYKYRNSKMERRKLLIWLVTPLAILTIGLGILPRLAFPAYAKTGRFMPVVWHRAFISLGVHPNWPFTGLRDKYNCPEISEGIVPSIIDRNAHCAWLVYAGKLGMSAEVAGPKLYDSDYDRGLRAVFFDTLRSYPRQVFETFLYYKPKRILEQTGFDDVARSLSCNIAGGRPGYSTNSTCCHVHRWTIFPDAGARRHPPNICAFLVRSVCAHSTAVGLDDATNWCRSLRIRVVLF